MARKLRARIVWTIALVSLLAPNWHCKQEPAGPSPSRSRVEAPYFTPPSDTIMSGAALQVTITCPTAGATIVYTNNGQIPSRSNGTVAQSPVRVFLQVGATLKAFAYLEGWDDSPTTTGTYALWPQVAAPTILPTTDTVWLSRPLRVAITCATAGAQIMYTVDGSEPTRTNGTAIASGQAIDLAGTTTVKAMAVHDTMYDSPATTSIYTLLIDRFSLGVGKQFDYDYRRYSDLWLGGIWWEVTDSGSVSYVVVNSVEIGDTVMSWEVRQRRDISRVYKNPMATPQIDTTFRQVDSCLITVLEDLRRYRHITVSGFEQSTTIILDQTYGPWIQLNFNRYGADSVQEYSWNIPPEGFRDSHVYRSNFGIVSRHFIGLLRPGMTSWGTIIQADIK
jgi:hypothetical protein